MCYPWPQIPDPLVKGKHRLIPPSGMAAGIYARTDESRGVWKAPAGQSAVIKASVLAHDVTAAEQELLNPTGINCLRRLGANILIYGARTLSGSTDASIYVPVERLRLFLSESLRNGLHWVVFEPNDEPLWSRIRLSVENFMYSLWRGGALVGTKPAQAYFVKCGLGSTMTAADIQKGIVNVEAGFAPLKPAEFIILRFSFFTSL